MEKEKEVVGIIASAFDLLHPGHLYTLSVAKQNCTRLVAALHVDPSIERPEKNRPVQTVFERYVQLASCMFVDAIIPYETENDLLNILKVLPIDVRFLGEEYSDKDFTGKSLDIPVIYIPRTHDFSSSELRKRLQR